jgi:hypothetical protein
MLRLAEFRSFQTWTGGKSRSVLFAGNSELEANDYLHDSFKSQRYFGKRHEEVRKTRVVPYIPFV